MSPRYFAIFLIVFVTVYALISYIDSGTIYWLGLLGGATGACLAFLTVHYLRRPGHSR